MNEKEKKFGPKSFTCTICDKTFKHNKYIYGHTKRVHKIELKVSGYLLCPMHNCKESFVTNAALRKHLATSHHKKIEIEELVFESKVDFLQWKQTTEKSTSSYFSLNSTKKIADGSRASHYHCHRSGSKPCSKKPPARFQACTKIGSHCPASMFAKEKENEVRVTYHKTHLGHDVELKDLTLSNLERSALEKCPSGEVSFNDLLHDVRENLASQFVAPLAVKKRDIKILKEAFETDEYDSGLSDSESVHRWVRLCLQADDSPVLFFRQEELPKGGEEFLLVIMTEFQKHLLMSSEKKVICLDCVHRRKGRRFYLTCIYIMDECEDAFPVAFCISDKVDVNVIKQFLESVKKSTGPLSCTYFMSESMSFYFDAWKEVMDDTSKWLWSMWYIDYELQKKLQASFKWESGERGQIYQVMRTLIECHSQNIFETMFKKYIDSLLVDQLTGAREFGEFLSEKYAPTMEFWAYCYRTEMKLGSNFHLHVLHRTLRFCGQEGTKTRLDKFIFVLLKYLKMKMLDRLRNILDDEKIEMVLETINVGHKAGLDISPEKISSLSDKVWLIKSEDEGNEYVVRDFDSCPEHCKLRCAECDICVHMYSCSCIPSMVNANLCQHIHAVVWKFLTPLHFSPVPSPAHDDIADSDSNDTSTSHDKNPALLGNVLKKSHEIYKSVVENRANLNEEALNLIMQKLSEVEICIDVHSGKKSTINHFVQNSVFPLSGQSSALQPIVFQDLQQPNFGGNLSQTSVPSQAQPQRYIIYVGENMPSNSTQVKVVL